MMQKKLKSLRLLLVPHPKNNHRAYLLHHPFLALFFSTLFSFQIFLNLNYSTRPQVLGFATSIYQQEVIRLTNQQRQQAGLAPLQENSLLDRAAALKGRDMFAKNYWAHVSPTGTTPWHFFEEEAYDYLMAGENLAKNFNTSAGVVAGWMASETHRENILNPDFTEIGLAVLNGNLQGEETTLVVQFFGKPAARTLAGSETRLVGQARAQTRESRPEPVEPSKAPTVWLPASVNAVIKEKGRVEPIGLPAQTFSGTQPWQLSWARFTKMQSLGFGQKVMSFGLILLIILFLLDSAVHLREKRVRESSHSLLHAGVLLLLVLAVIYSSFGLVL